MRTLTTMTLAALMGASALALGSSSASAARIVCNDEGDCWHVKSDFDYRPEFRLTIHHDNWRWKQGENYRWREHAGRGYWHGNTWQDF
jgi:hypothetical protein